MAYMPIYDLFIRNIVICIIIIAIVIGILSDMSPSHAFSSRGRRHSPVTPPSVRNLYTHTQNEISRFIIRI